ncbi:tetratricopeptide repeat protein [Oleiharenicola sp. Vm1]|uniref:tetratricopeptide repeat protein n=1 Tax=Oleiharenicola sp. Vm1 TaxID=3398393 RepID=UPI0039F4AEA6
MNTVPAGGLVAGAVSLPREPDAPALRELHDLYDAGRHLDAHQSLARFAPLADWRVSVPALLLGGRLAHVLGDSTLSDRLHTRAYRIAPEDEDAVYYFAQRRWNKHGPLETLHFLRARSRPAEPATLTQAHTRLLEARALSLYRDFSTANDLVEQVLVRFPDDAWGWVEKSYVLEREDRVEAALAAAREASRLRPWYRPALHAEAHYLQALNRDDEAIALLQSALPRLQSGSLAQALVVALEEQGRHAETLPLLDRIAELLPLAERAQRDWINARRCDAAHRTGQSGLALRAAQRVDTAYYRLVAARLSLPEPAGPRVQLPVGFVRQHHMTCAPATLAALSRFWGVPADQAEIARVICYDGSPDHEERHWAESAGWICREFAVDWATTRTLLDRGCPFAIVTTEAESAHMQAVVGYDATLETVLIRDPYRRDVSEWHAPSFSRATPPTARAARSSCRATGPACSTASSCPTRRSTTSCTSCAGACIGTTAPPPPPRSKRCAVAPRAPPHAGRHLRPRPLRWPSGGRAPSLRRIRERFPSDYNWRLRELHLLGRLGFTAERRALVAELGAPAGAAPVFRREHAEELLRDARTRPHAGRLLRALLRRQPVDAPGLRAFSRFLWEEGQSGPATDIARLAATLGEKTEHLWSEYFRACRHVGRTGECLDLLRRRHAAWGTASSQPASTLHQCLDLLDRTDEGLAVLEEACRLRPADGDLMLFAADAFARAGHHARADELLATARERASRPAWCRTAARIAGYRTDHAAALGFWRELLQSDPTDQGVHAAVARLLALTAGRGAALEHLQAAVRELPHNAPLARLLVEWLREAPAEAALAAIDRVLVLDPVDAWALREKALTLRRLVRFDDALVAADLARRIDPGAAVSHGVRGDVLVSLGRREEAHESYAAGLRLSIEADWLYEPLLGTCADYAARRAAVQFLQREILQQPAIESACHQFRLTARTVLSADELTARLLEFRTARPECWSSWSALVNNLVDVRRLDEALAHARGATERFPLVPRTWLDLGVVHDAREDFPAAVVAFERALALSPAWGLVSRRLASTHERLLAFDQARHAIERAIAADPIDPFSHGWLADLLWRRKQPDAAVAAMTRAVRLRVDYDWAWNRFAEWARLTDQPDLPRRIADELTQTHAGEPALWLRIAQLHFADPAPDEALRALDRAATLDPASHEAWDLRAQLLAHHRRFDEALESCRPAAFGNRVPHFLRGRAAWIEHQHGRTDEAIRLMEGLVAEHPDYVWGWIQLAEWHWAGGHLPETQAAAERWAWLAPDSPIPHGYLAALHRKAGRRREAKESFARAIARDPVYDFGAFELLQMHLEDAEVEAANRVWRHIDAHFPKADSLLAELRLAIVRGDRTKLAPLLEALARQPTHAADRLQTATDRLLAAGWRRETERALHPLLAREDVLPEVGASWFRTRDYAAMLPTLWLLHRARPAAGPRQHACGALLSHLAEKRRSWRLALVCRLGRKFLHAHTHTWSLAGYALVTVGRYGDAVRWMDDWSTRAPQPEPWMLHNLMLACFGTGRDREDARCSMSFCARRRTTSTPSISSSAPANTPWPARPESPAPGSTLPAPATRLISTPRCACSPKR